MNVAIIFQKAIIQLCFLNAINIHFSADIESSILSINIMINNVNC